jgi:DNA-binding CsgD family transcriptional regulator
VSRAIALEMREMKRRGGTYQEIADKFGVTVSTVWMYVH